eukprot:7213444-Prymnesium_polylepis.1
MATAASRWRTWRAARAAGCSASWAVRPRCRRPHTARSGGSLSSTRSATWPSPATTSTSGTSTRSAPSCSSHASTATATASSATARRSRRSSFSCGRRATEATSRTCPLRARPARMDPTARCGCRGSGLRCCIGRCRNAFGKTTYFAFV